MTNRFPNPATASVAMLGLLMLTTAATAIDEPEGDASAEESTPAGFGPFEHMVGRWKGQAVPSDNPLRGWPESHEWAWAFEEGKPVAISLTFEGGKVVSGGQLTFDEKTKTYRLDATDLAGAPIRFVGPLDAKTGILTLDRRGPGPNGDERLTIRPNANKIRYDFWFDRKERGSPQFERVIQVNLGKEGVNFAAGGAMSRGPRCIVTGGAATITVSAGGSTFSVCCSGCRDEVLADPDKYVAKLKARMTASKGDGGNKIRTGSGDGSFDLSSGRRPAGDSTGKKMEKNEKDAPPPSPAPTADPEDEPAPKPDEPAPSPTVDADARRKAASLLRLGQALEKQKKADGALKFYQRVVDEYPKTPEAKTAEERIKALDED